MVQVTDMNELPAGVDESPALTFDEIDQRVAQQLAQVDLAQRQGATAEQVLDLCDTIIFGAMKELLKTLKACNIEPKKIQLPGGRA